VVQVKDCVINFRGIHWSDTRSPEAHLYRRGMGTGGAYYEGRITITETTRATWTWT